MLIPFTLHVYLSGSLKRKLKKQRDDKIKMLQLIINLFNNAVAVTTENLINKSIKSTLEKATDIVSNF